MPGLREKRDRRQEPVSPYFRGLSPPRHADHDPASPQLRKSEKSEIPYRALRMTALLPSRHFELDSESRFLRSRSRVKAGIQYGYTTG
jgi:hypothetical protein